MSNFSNQPFHRRFAVLGDIAEQAFERYAIAHNYSFERFGFHRPNLKRFGQLSRELRMMPDYICERGKETIFVECKGTNKSTFVLKPDTLEALFEISQFFKIEPYFFVYNSRAKQVALFHAEKALLIFPGLKRLKFENENKEYVNFPGDILPWEKEKTDEL